MKNVTTAGLVVTCAIFGNAIVSAQHWLDLTNESPVIEKRDGLATGRGGDSGMSGQAPTKPSLEVATESMLLVGSEAKRVLFEVSIKNVGTTAISIPWLAKERGRSLLSKGPEYLDLLVVAPDISGTSRIVTVVPLVGSATMPSSLLSLQPGETANIRADAPLNLVSVVTPDAFPQTVELRVDVWLRKQAGNWSSPVSSRTSVPIDVSLLTPR